MDSDPEDLPTLEEVVAPDFRCGPLRLPVAAPEDDTPGDFTILRAAPASVSGPTSEFVGADGLSRALQEIDGIRKNKVVGVAEDDGDESILITRVLVEAGDRERQINARWICRWERSEPPSLREIRVEHYEEIVRHLPQPLFRDETAAILAGPAQSDGRVAQGIEFWAGRITRIGDMALTGHHGIAAGDVNGDGRDDLYVCDAGSLPNRLLLQQPDGTVVDAAAEAGVDFLEDSRGALLIDLDNDGDQDLVVATVAMIVFAENDGTGRFHLRGGHPGAPSPFSLSAADYDLDGDLDVHVCVYGAADDPVSGTRGFEAASPAPFHDAQNGGRNVLMENRRGFRFVDVTAAVGLEVNNRRWSFAAAWEDYDLDGDPDLYVANDFGRNCLYRNDPAPEGGAGRRFVDVAAGAGVEDIGAGMSVAWGDPNRDGRMDILVGNMFSSAGLRVAFQPNFAPGRGAEDLGGLRRMARGNSLFLADPDGGSFVDAGESAGASMGRWAWSSAFADLNNDGWEDIVVANGYLTNTREDDL